MSGVRSLLRYLETRHNRPEICFVGEPTDMEVVIGHKGKLTTRCRVKGQACHSSLAPQGVNAVEYAARVVTYLSEMATRKQLEGPFDRAYDVPHSTVHTGVIQGGTMVNVVPEECQFLFEFRNLPADSPQAMLNEVQTFAREKLQPSMTTINPETGFLWEEESSFSGLDTAADAGVVHLAQQFSGSRGTRKSCFRDRSRWIRQIRHTGNSLRPPDPFNKLTSPMSSSVSANSPLVKYLSATLSSTWELPRYSGQPGIFSLQPFLVYTAGLLTSAYPVWARQVNACRFLIRED